jgi:hypothetical protein
MHVADKKTGSQLDETSMMVGPLRIVCWRCDGCLWVCEDHLNRPCGCGATGAPCPICNKDDAPRMPEGFEVDTDKNGTRH